MTRRATLTASLIMALALVPGCAPGLAANPRFATNAGAGPQGKPTTSSAPNGPAPIAKPKNELPWHDCTSKEFTQAAAPAPVGVKLECANYDADLDPIAGLVVVHRFAVALAERRGLDPDHPRSLTRSVILT